MDQTLASMISVGVTGMTSRCSMVPCSRSRISAAPVRMMESMVTLLMICITPPNHILLSEGLKRARTSSATGGAGRRAVALHEFVDLGQHNLLDIAVAREGLAHARGIHIQLQLGVLPASTSR